MSLRDCTDPYPLLHHCVLLIGLAGCAGATIEDTSPPQGDTADATADDTGPGETDEPNETAETGEASAWPLYVNELVSDNDGSTLDPDGNPLDWLELYNAGDVPIDLEDFGLSDDWSDPHQHLFPSIEVPAGGWLLLWADGNAKGGDDHVDFKLSADGEGLGLFDPDGASIDWLVFPALAEGEAWARIPDGGEDWATTPVGTPGASNRQLIEETITLVEAGAEWSYWDQGVSPGGGWADPDFDDAAWPRGTAPLGYGDEMTTTISYGADSNNKQITAWFRTRFELNEVAAESAAEMSIAIRCDDGAVVYLNGQELHRRNMSDGEVTPDTLASATVSGDDETTYFSSEVSVDALLSGENVVAVELHQAATTSSDTVIDLSLTLSTLSEVD